MGHPSSFFDDLDAKFRYLITGPKPLALHGRVIGHGAPKRPVPLQELRALLTEYENWPLHDAVMRELIRRANAPTGGEPWMIAIAWMLLPALRKASGDLARGFPGDPADLDAEILAGLINAVHTFGPCGPRIAWHLVDKAQLAARRLRRREARAILGLPPTSNRKALHPAWQHPGATDAQPPEPWHDPAVVLQSAVRAGALRQDEADLLTLAQLEGRTLREIATDTGSPTPPSASATCAPDTGCASSWRRRVGQSKSEDAVGGRADSSDDRGPRWIACQSSLRDVLRS